jgi:hypothetical protein
MESNVIDDTLTSSVLSFLTYVGKENWLVLVSQG